MDLDDLVCTLCLFQFDREEHLPLMIPKCGHTFCTKCLQGILSKLSPNQDFVCPEDHNVMKLATKDISEFPQNLVLLRLLDKRPAFNISEKESDSYSREGRSMKKTNKSSSQNSIQEFCSPMGSPSALRKSSTKNSFIQQDLLSFIHGDSNVCKEHSKKMEVVCLDDSCRICANCALFGCHRNHDIRPEEEILKDIAGRAEKLVDIFQSLEKNQSILVDQEFVDKYNEKIRRKCDEIIKLVRQKFNDYVNLLRIKEKCLLGEISGRFSQLEESLKTTRQPPQDLQDKVNRWKTRAHDSLLAVTEKSEKGDIAFEMLEERNNLENDLLYLGEKLNSSLEKSFETSSKLLEDTLSKITINFDSNFSKNLELLCSVKIPEISLQSYNINSIIKENPRIGSGIPLSDIVNKSPIKENRCFRDKSESKTTALKDDIQEKQIKNRSKSPLQRQPSLSIDKSSLVDDDNLISTLKLESINDRIGISLEKGLDEDNNLLDFEWKDLNNELQMMENPTSGSRGRAGVSQNPPQRRLSGNVNSLTNLNKEEFKEIDRFEYNNQAGRLSSSKEDIQATRREKLTFSGKKSSSRQVSPFRKNTPEHLTTKPPKSKKRSVLKVADKFEPVVEALEQNVLDVADLTGAELGDQGVLALVEILKDNTTLKSLKLLKNKITDEGGIALANLLYTNKTLHTLNLTQNQLTEKTLDAFIEVIQSLKSIRLKSLYVSQNLMSLRNVKQKLKELAELGVNTIL